ncbi:MAG: DNA-directed RNA polymerase subunit alpha [Candidatus Hydrogenedentes bacterium]|nr:DNA-directed RNA polymerase subunit alpha [Candidatus Hydrogenedentota bacterium]
MIAKEFTIPRYVKIDDEANVKFSRITVEPFERGYGTTVGNSLRRVLLASLQGTAVTAIRVEGISNEFSAIPGVREDVTEFVLNLKKCDLRLNRDEALIFTYSFSGEGEITAGDIFKDQELVDVFNPEHVVLTSTSKSTKLEMEIKVDRGRGYVTAEHFELEHAPIDTIYLDANFSPVKKVNFQVEDARVGQTTDYDRLLLDIWTNGSISPERALEEAAGLLINHLRIFVKQEQEGDALGGDNAPEDPELMRTLARNVDELELSVRAANCLKAANIRTIGDLVAREESEMLQFHNFGKKSLDEIKALLDSMGMSLGMKVGAPAAASVPAAPAVEDEPDNDEDE